jgi:hypothetical protein
MSENVLYDTASTTSTLNDTLNATTIQRDIWLENTLAKYHYSTPQPQYLSKIEILLSNWSTQPSPILEVRSDTEAEQSDTESIKSTISNTPLNSRANTEAYKRVHGGGLFLNKELNRDSTLSARCTYLESVTKFNRRGTCPLSKIA